MLSRLFYKLTKTGHLCAKGVQNFGTGNRLMERIPRDIKNCSRLRPPMEGPKSSEDIEPKAETDTSFVWANHAAPPTHTFNLFNIHGWWEHKKKEFCEDHQKYNHQMVQDMGYNIAAASFVLHWEGKVKFKDSDWIQSTKSSPARLPSSYVPHYVVVAIDASSTLITYEGLKNMSNLTNLKWLSFKSCLFIDDWCIDKIAGNYPSLEYLDISDCKNVTERGLEAIYKLFALKTLIVTNHHKSAAFELTCLMLEDINPNLKCQILNSRYSNGSEELHEKNDTS